MKVERTVEVAATPAEAFAKLSDVKLLASLFSGFMEWYPTEQPNRFRTVILMGPAPLGGEIELEFWPESGNVTWHNTRGIHFLGRFLIQRSDVGSRVKLRIFYHLDGGLGSRLAEWVAARTIDRRAGEALGRLRRSIESQPPRRRRAA
ncbi:MAG TPA: SRPBCC family protein [Candidatus Dormibacteraeota bacterium]|jgi:carbon monoxide dehydrogenase subunit G